MKGFSDSLYIVAVHSEFSAQESQKLVLGLAYKSFVCYALALNYPYCDNVLYCWYRELLIVLLLNTLYVHRLKAYV